MTKKRGSHLTHWSRVTHICVDKLTTIGSDNGLSPGRRHAITWTIVGILLIGPIGTNVSEISSGIQPFAFKKMHLKFSSAEWRPCCLGLNVLKEKLTIWCSTSSQIYPLRLILPPAVSNFYICSRWVLSFGISVVLSHTITIATDSIQFSAIATIQPDLGLTRPPTQVMHVQTKICWNTNQVWLTLLTGMAIKITITTLRSRQKAHYMRTIFSNAVFWMKTFVSWIKCHCVMNKNTLETCKNPRPTSGWRKLTKPCTT